MRRTRIAALALAALLLLAGCAAPAEKPADFRVVASFYPIWVLAANVIGEVPGVELSLLAPPQTGCLHNYQLLPQDMKKLENARVLLLNGAEMEHFLEDVLPSFPDLTVADTSAGLTLLPGSGAAHEGHDHGVNPHVWLDVDNAIAQTRAIASCLAAALPEQAAAFAANAEAYCARLEALRQEMTETLAPVAGAKLVTSHDAFAYFSAEFSLEDAAVIQQDEETDPSAAEIGAICDLIRQEAIPAVFIEKDTTGTAPGAIARETGAKLVPLDTITTGDMTPDAYEKAQRANARAVAEAFS